MEKDVVWRSSFWLGFFSGIFTLAISCVLFFLLSKWNKRKKNVLSERKGPFNSLQYPLCENMESALWLNRIIGKLWEKLETTWSDLLMKELQQLAKKHQPQFLKDCFRTFSADTIVLDADMDWMARSSEVRVTATLLGIKPPLLSVRKINIHSKLRLELGLNDCSWGIESLKFSFVQQPKVYLEIVPLASGIDLMDIPAFRSWLYHLLTVKAFEKMLFPNKISVPIQPTSSRSFQSLTSHPGNSSSLLSFFYTLKDNASYPPGTDGVLTIRILSAQISISEDLFANYSEWNPSITIQLGRQVMTTHKSYRTNEPIFEEKFEFLITNQCKQWINIRLYHTPQGLFQMVNSLGQDILIGSGWLPLEVCKDAVDKNMDIWLPLIASRWSHSSSSSFQPHSIASVHVKYSYEKLWDPTALETTPKIENNLSNHIDFEESSIPQGWIQIHLLEAYQLHHMDNPDCFINDVRCLLEWGSHKASFTSLRNEICPVWNAFTEFPVCHIQEEYLTLTVMDQDPFAKEALLGRAYICIDHYGDIQPKEYWIPIDKNGIVHSDNTHSNGWLRLWLTFKATLQDESFYTWTRSGNNFVIQPDIDYWKKRLVSPFHTYHDSSRHTLSNNSIRLFRQLENLDWREAAQLVMRRTPLSLWRLANQSLNTIWHSTGVSSLVSVQNETGTTNLCTKPWMITFQTGDCWGAGTDASVWIQLFDENGNHTERLLFSNSDGSHFCRRGQDTFVISVPDSLQIPNKIRVGHQGSGLFPSWFLKRVVIQPASSVESWQREFVCNQWIIYSRRNGKDGMECIVNGM
ncbi:Synaptotagmin-5 [Galdieria sulphuraria]|nr:Synaptotagmin-5 [Galdieria sulphuraria]